MKKLSTLVLIFVFLIGCSGNKGKFEFVGNSMLPTIKNQQTVIVDLNYMLY
ncbi:hypothetical protein [Metabacillus litoralis]|uniref:hypothetical protein n=1 Tax=Metabacillus TaxID=2675233 RepID=UPI0013CE8245|nr:hypothetical protein [Metabacillus litoralis]MCM3163384.1 hypothetical protein [Metabacillus litoralis]